MKKIDKAIEILTAFKEGKTIECYSEITDTWWRKIKEYGELITILSRGDELKLRIAKEPIYRPYANAEEFLKASKEHGRYFKRNDSLAYWLPSVVYNDGVDITVDRIASWSHKYIDMLKYTWADGTPCGILEQ